MDNCKPKGPMNSVGTNAQSKQSCANGNRAVHPIVVHDLVQLRGWSLRYSLTGQGRKSRKNPYQKSIRMKNILHIDM